MKEKIIEWEQVPSFVVWNRITALRRARKMTRAELAIKAKISFPYLSQIEAGLDYGVSEEFKNQIAEALDVPVKEIFPVRVQGMTIIATGEKLKVAKKK